MTSSPKIRKCFKSTNRILHDAIFNQSNGVSRYSMYKAVCGKEWLQIYLDTLIAKQKKQVKYYENNRRFKVCVGEPVISTKKVTS